MENKKLYNMTLEEFRALSDCFDVQEDDLPPDAIIYGKDGKIEQIIDELIEKDF